MDRCPSGYLIIASLSGIIFGIGLIATTPSEWSQAERLSSLSQSEFEKVRLKAVKEVAHRFNQEEPTYQRINLTSFSRARAMVNPETQPNTTGELQVGILKANFCQETTLVSKSAPLCTEPGLFLLCGHSAYRCVPKDWDGRCTKVFLVPSVTIRTTGEVQQALQHQEPYRVKRAAGAAIAIGAGLAIGIGTSAGALGLSATTYHKLSTHLSQDMDQIADSLATLQQQINSLAEVSLQNSASVPRLQLQFTPPRGASPRLLGIQLCRALRLERNVRSPRQRCQLPVCGEDLVAGPYRDRFSRAAELELELELRETGAPAAGKRLLQAEAGAENEPEAVAGSRRSGGGGSLLRWFVTLILCAAFLGLGLSVSILGPTFQDLATNVNHNISSLSLIFVGRAFGYLSGSVIGGVLFDAMNHFLLLGMSMLATTVGLYLVPFCKRAVLLIVMMSVFGVSMGILDTGGNVLILAIWGDKGAPHMQALHFSFALGAFLAPLLAKLALGTMVSAGNRTEANFSHSLDQPSEADPGPLFGVPDNVNLLWAYIIIGTYIFVVCIFLFVLFLKKSSQQDKAKASAQRSRRAKYHNALLCLLFLFFFFYVGAEVTYGSYVFSFATTHAGMAESEAAGLNSIFWGTFAACRGLAIFFATCLQPGTMIVLSNIGSLVSSLFLVLFNKSAACLWIATSVYGASMATTFPSGISWIEQYTTIHGKAAAFFVVGAALGEMAIPAVIGILQGKYADLPVVLYTSLGAAIATAVLFPVMYKLATSPLHRQQKEHRKSEDQKALLSSSGLNDYEEENEEDDAEKWNEMDFEVVEMNDTMRSSVIETSRSILREPTAEVSSQFHSNALVCEFSPVNTGKSPVSQLQETRTKGTNT
ncbi:LOW QUALITY PROTEIN: sodium-dependent glucose transporter 1 [Pteronotus mesoamericanus]|uniref:LOW QUALITY PROTEIN: sodium-dependent glucose transporter 1 n=1 Tax=Pteronotus mesoamericanus TaxID=1884717 RepID=UPI0023ED056A|nr:LOW QUALITY PROTEIN: sodium-dependent glucose transporter 1 [Pteronotus parnellii mesoamericanus]